MRIREMYIYMVLPIIFLAVLTTEASELIQLMREYPLPTQHIKEGECHLSLPKLEQSQQTGLPSLPYELVRVIIPAGYAIDTIITKEQSDTIKLEAPLAIVTTLVGEELQKADLARAEKTPIVELLSIQKKSGISIAFLAINPVSVLGDSIRTVRSLTTTIRLQQRTKRRELTQRNITQLPFPVENPEAINSYKLTPPNRNTVDYLLITTEEMKHAVADYTIDDLLRLREAQGLQTAVLTLKEIESNYIGEDLPAKIRNAIKAYVTDHGTKYVFIAGDHSVVPARILTVFWGSAGPERFQAASDLYYQCHDGSFNEDGDSLYGEMATDGPGWNQMDFMPEVAIGRTPAENPIELSNFIAKTLRYETSPSKTEALQRVLFAGEHLGFTGDMLYAKPSLEELRLGADVGGFINDGFSNINDIETQTLYDADRPESGRWGKREISDSINSNRFSILSHVGHGLTSEGLHMKNGDVAKLNNSFPLFLYSEACVIARFEEHSILEELLNSHRSGLWGAVANSGYGCLAPPSTNGPTHRLHRTFWHGACRSETPIHRVGDLAVFMHDLNAAVKMNHMPYVHYETTLFADPATVLRLPGSNTINKTAIIKPHRQSVAVQREALTVEWLDAGNSSVTLSLIADNGSNISLDGTFKPGKPLSVPIPQTVHAGTYTLTITGDHSSASSEPFRITSPTSVVITAPTDADIITSNKSYTIEWEGPSRVALFLLKNSTPIQQICTSISGNSFRWTPETNLPRGEYTIGLIPLETPGTMVQSEAFHLTHAMITTYPWKEDFDSFQLGKELRNYWRQSQRDALEWQVHRGPTPRREAFASSPRTGASSDHTSGEGNYMFIEADMFSTMLKIGDLMLPPLDLSNAREPQLSFWYHMFSSTNMMGALSLYVIHNGYIDTLLVSRVRDQGDSWQQMSADLTPWQGDTIQLMLRAMTGEMEDSDICIDDVLVTTSGEVSITTETTTQKPKKIYATPTISTHGEPIRFYLPLNSAKSITGAIFDKLGNLMDYYEGSVNADGLIMTWDINNSAGQLVAPGTYLFVGQCLKQDGTTERFSISVGVQR